MVVRMKIAIAWLADKIDDFDDFLCRHFRLFWRLRCLLGGVPWGTSGRFRGPGGEH